MKAISKVVIITILITCIVSAVNAETPAENVGQQCAHSVLRVTPENTKGLNIIYGVVIANVHNHKNTLNPKIENMSFDKLVKEICRYVIEGGHENTMQSLVDGANKVMLK